MSVVENIETAEETDATAQEKRNRYHIAIYALIISFTFIAVLDLACVALIVYMECISPSWFPIEAFDTAQERTLLSTGLSMIGIAISVWATLNILNAFDKKDIVEIGQNVEKLKEDSRELQAFKQKYDIEIRQLKEQSKNTFLYYIEQNADDLAMSLIANKIADMSADDQIPYSQLTIVMQHYSRVRQIYSQLGANTLMANIAEKGINIIKKLLKAEPCPSGDVERFLHYCRAELHFYQAYYGEGQSWFKNSKNAIDEYNAAMSFFRVTLPEFNPRKVCTNPELITVNHHEYDPMILAYLCNTYGECYSKAVQGYNSDPSVCSDSSEIETMRMKAVFYCGCAVKLTEKKNQIYLRNFGCALEAAYGTQAFEGDIAKDTAAAYQKAMDISIAGNEIPYKVFYTWLSFYHKCINHQLGISPKKLEGTVWSVTQDKIPEHPIYKDFSRALAYADLACKTYPDKLVFLKFRAFVLRDRCIWERKNNGQTDLAKQYYEEFSRVFQTLDILCNGNHDNFMKELHHWNDLLK